MIRSTRLALAALAASSLTVLAQAPADAGGARPAAPGARDRRDRAARRRPRRRGRGQRPEPRRAAPHPAADPPRGSTGTRGCSTSSRLHGGALTLAEGVAPFPLDQTFLLHSRPASTHVIYLDFDGTTVSGHGVELGAGQRLLLRVQPRWRPQHLQRHREGAGPVGVAAGRRGLRRLRRRRHHPGPGRSGHRPHERRSTRTSAPGRPSRTTPPSSSAVCTSGCGGVAYVGVFDDFGRGPSRTPTTSRPGSSGTCSPATTPRTSPRRSATRWATTSASATTARRPHVGVHQRELLLRPRDVGADHGRRLPEAARAVEQGRVHQRQQHPRTT